MGDYALLDYLVRSCLRGRRQAGGSTGTFLVCTIALLMMDVAECKALSTVHQLAWNISPRVSCWYDNPTEPSNVLRRVRENIGISSPAKQIDNFSAVLNIQNILRENWRRRSLRSDPTHCGYFWWDKRRAHGDSWIIKIKPNSQEGIPDNALDVHRHVPSRGIAAVLPYRSELPIIRASLFASFPKWGYAGGENESAFAGDHRIPGNITGASAFFEREAQKNHLTNHKAKN